MKIPEIIKTQLGDIYKIESFQEDKFILEQNSFFYSYLINSDDFTQIRNGIIFPSGVKAENPQEYIEWLKRYKENKSCN